MKQHLKLAAVLLVGILVGGISLRYGQHVVIENFNACIEDGLHNVQTLDDLFNLQVSCKPSKIVQKVFFW